DRDDLGACREPAEGLADSVGSASADAGVDLVEDQRLASAHRRDRKRDARELAARGGLGDRRERQSGVWADQEAGLVGTCGSGYRRVSSTRNSPSPRPIPLSSSATAAANDG